MDAYKDGIDRTCDSVDASIKVSFTYFKSTLYCCVQSLLLQTIANYLKTLALLEMKN